jgi:hypothetical protein
VVDHGEETAWFQKTSSAVMHLFPCILPDAVCARCGCVNSTSTRPQLQSAIINHQNTSHGQYHARNPSYTLLY